MDRPRIEVWREFSRIDDIPVAPDFTSIVRSPRLAQVIRANLSSGAVVIAALSPQGLCGYATMVPSSALVHDRWHNAPGVFELGAVEVAHSARRKHVATSLLEALAGAMPVRSLVLFARAFFGHWDFVAAGLDPVAYRRVLLTGLMRVGFVRCETNDPEIQDHPLNFLAARYGEDASASSLLAFMQRLRMHPDAGA